MLQCTYEDTLKWAYEDGGVLPQFERSRINSSNFAVERETVLLHHTLWKRLNDMAEAKKMTLTKKKHLKMRATAYWNAIKRTIDILSRFLSCIQYETSKSSIRQVYIVRLILFDYSTHI